MSTPNKQSKQSKQSKTSATKGDGEQGAVSPETMGNDLNTDTDAGVNEDTGTLLPPGMSQEDFDRMVAAQLDAPGLIGTGKIEADGTINLAGGSDDTSTPKRRPRNAEPNLIGFTNEMELGVRCNGACKLVRPISHFWARGWESNPELKITAINKPEDAESLAKTCITCRERARKGMRKYHQNRGHGNSNKFNGGHIGFKMHETRISSGLTDYIVTIPAKFVPLLEEAVTTIREKALADPDLRALLGHMEDPSSPEVEGDD